MLKLFTAGHRTYVLSVVALVCALLIQADSQGIFELAPMLRLILTMILTIIVPMIPVFIRKAIAAAVRTELDR